MQTFIMQKAKQLILSKNPEATEEELQEMTMEEIEDDLIDYTSQAEKWANHILTALKAEFNLKELSEEIAKKAIVIVKAN